MVDSGSSNSNKFGKKPHRSKRVLPPEHPFFHAPKKRRRRVNAAILSTLSLIVLAAAGSILFRRNPFITPELFLAIIISLFATMALLYVIGRNLIKLYFERQKGFRAKLVLAFSLTAGVPMLLLALVGTGFLNQAVDDLINPQLESVLVNAKDVADGYTQSIVQRHYDIADFFLGEKSANELLLSPSESERRLTELREVRDFQAAWVLDVEGNIIAQTTAPGTMDSSWQLPRRTLAAALSQGDSAFDIRDRLDGTGEVIVATPILGLPDENGEPMHVGFLLTAQLVPERLSNRIDVLTQVLQEYRNLERNRGEIRTLYILVFVTLALFIFLTATWLAQNLAKDLAGPVQVLVKKTQEVSEGNLDVHVDLDEKTELGLLVTAFNQMTAELKASRTSIETTNAELTARNRESARKQIYIETLLEDIPNGVISLDNDGRLTTMNAAAGEILELDPKEVVGKAASDVFKVQPIDRLRFWIEQMQHSRAQRLKRQLTLNQKDENRYLDVTLSAFEDPMTEGPGYLIVLEDLSELLRAQRAAAWQEVARRIAHEIKNPLTPISLAAQHIQRKCCPSGLTLPPLPGIDGAPPSGLPPTFQPPQIGASQPEIDNEKMEEILGPAMKIILDGIADIQQLVNEFSNFARMPEAKLEPNDFPKLVASTLESYKPIYPKVTFEEKWPPDMPTVSFDLEQMKRVLRNILDNAIEAMEQRGTVSISLEHDSLFCIARLVIADDGPGIPAEYKDRLFTPYFSTKGSRGTGLGLAIVNKIISDHNGYIRVRDNTPTGARVIIELPTGYSVASTWQSRPSEA